MRETELDKKHIPVLFTELTQIFEIRNDKKNIIIDGTLGIGGHAEEIIKKLNPLDVFVGFDADIKNLELAKIRLKNTVEKSKAKVFFINSNFVNLKEELKKIGIKSISGIYFDLGLSSLHIDEAEDDLVLGKTDP